MHGSKNGKHIKIKKICYVDFTFYLVIDEQ